MVRGCVVALATGLVVLVCAVPAVASTITVTTSADDQRAGDGECSLRKAIRDVDAPGSTQHDCTPAAFGANTIVLSSGSYLLGGQPLTIDSTVTSLTILGSGEAKTFIDAQLSGSRVFEVASGATVVMRDLTIANGHATDGADAKPAVGAPGQAGDNGGGILNRGTLTIVDSGLTGNRAGDGGSGGGNASGDGGPAGAGGSGGAIYNTGTLTLDGVTLSDNHAGAGGIGGVGGQDSDGNAGGPGGPGGAGGAIMNTGGSLIVQDSTLRSDTAGAGGAGGSGGSDSAATGDAGGPGGAGGDGGGIASDGGSLSVTNTTFASDAAGLGGDGGSGGAAPSSGGTGGVGGPGGSGGSGGAMETAGTSGVTVLQSTAAGNNAGSGGGGGAGGAGTTDGTPGAAGASGSAGGMSALGAPITLENSLLALSGGGNCGSGILDGGHNIAFGDASCPATFANANPDLGALQDNGGPAPTIELAPGSAAIDQIPATGAGCPATDERGVSRPSGAKCDIGAYEAAPPSASTLPASAVIRNAAFLSASVTANAGAASVTFQYGRTTHYGRTSRAATASGVRPLVVSLRVIHLRPNTTYHYRVVVAAQDGTSYGLDRTFTTAVAVIRHLRVSPARLAPGQAAIVRYTDSARALTRFVVWHCVEGRETCIRYVPLRRFTHRDRKGANHLRLNSRGLGTGRYLLAATTKFRGNSGPTVSVRFKVV